MASVSKLWVMWGGYAGCVGAVWLGRALTPLGFLGPSEFGGVANHSVDHLHWCSSLNIERPGSVSNELEGPGTRTHQRTLFPRRSRTGRRPGPHGLWCQQPAPRGGRNQPTVQRYEYIQRRG